MSNKKAGEPDKTLNRILKMVNKLSESEECRADEDKMRVVRFIKAALDTYFMD